MPTFLLPEEGKVVLVGVGAPDGAWPWGRRGPGTLGVPCGCGHSSDLLHYGFFSLCNQKSQNYSYKQDNISSCIQDRLLNPNQPGLFLLKLIF